MMNMLTENIGFYLLKSYWRIREEKMMTSPLTNREGNNLEKGIQRTYSSSDLLLDQLFDLSILSTHQ